ncbi:MAG: PPC domain-containing protein, partial [Planctomycetaceae bacterium]
QILKSRQCVVNGVLAKSRDVDSFQVLLKKGQTLVASMTANTRLGSPMDGLIQVVSARGFVLAQDDDSLGLDPFITWTARKDGEYYVRVFAFPSKTNSSIQLAGGPEFVYRLTITTAPYVDFTIPSAFTGKAPRELQVIGWNLEKSQKTWTVNAETRGVSDQYFQTGWSNTISLKRVPHSSQVESEPNGRTKPQVVELPVTISGTIGAARDRDVFSFEAKKGQALRISVESRRLGFPLDPVIRISDDKGKQLAETDTRSAQTIDESITWTAPSQGRFLAEVRDLFDHGGSRYSYRLTIEPVRAEVSATVEKDRWELADKSLSIKLTVSRSGGFNKPVRFEAVELPAGVIAKPVTSEVKGATAKAVMLVLSRKPDAPARGSGVLRIVGRVGDVKDAVTFATAAIDRLPDRTEHLWLFVKPVPQKKKKKKK